MIGLRCFRPVLTKIEHRFIEERLRAVSRITDLLPNWRCDNTLQCEVACIDLLYHQPCSIQTLCVAWHLSHMFIWKGSSLFQGIVSYRNNLATFQAGIACDSGYIIMPPRTILSIPVQMRSIPITFSAMSLSRRSGKRSCHLIASLITHPLSV